MRPGRHTDGAEEPPGRDQMKTIAELRTAGVAEELNMSGSWGRRADVPEASAYTIRERDSHIAYLQRLLPPARHPDQGPRSQVKPTPPADRAHPPPSRPARPLLRPNTPHHNYGRRLQIHHPTSHQPRPRPNRKPRSPRNAKPPPDHRP